MNSSMLKESILDFAPRRLSRLLAVGNVVEET